MKSIGLILFLILIRDIHGQSPNLTITPSEIKSEKKATIPDLQSLDQYKKSTFLSSMELPFSTSSNGVYAATFPMAWTEIKDLLLDSMYAFSSTELKLLHQTKGHTNVLQPSEYETSIKIENRTIIAKASFNKSLAFLTPMTANKTAFLFQGNAVGSFGFRGKHPGVRILYYNNDNDFALSITPKEIGQELILIKTNFDSQTSIKKEVEQLQNRIQLAAKKNKVTPWKSRLYSFDRTEIPIIDFNIEHRYPNIEKSFFINQGTKYIVSKAYQKNAFCMNKKGTTITSEAEIRVLPPSRPSGIDKATPKNMIFDDSFLVLAKRTDNPNPYFAVFLCNNELMQSFK